MDASSAGSDSLRSVAKAKSDKEIPNSGTVITMASLNEPLLVNEAAASSKPAWKQHGQKQQLVSVLHMPSAALRGVPLTSLLLGRAQLFAERGRAAREDPKGTYAQSQPVRALDVFVSHSWACPRMFKYCALLVHFNLHAAIVATAAFHAAAFAIELLLHDRAWLRPLLVSQQRPSDLIICDDCLTVPGCQTLGPLVFLVALASAHRLRRPTHLFLDICCISQDNEHAKELGIASIGAILDRSQRMLALVSADYFQRLWCVFELAAYHRRAGRRRLDLVALHAPISLLGWILCFTCFYAGQTLFVYSPSAALLAGDSTSVVLVGICVAFMLPGALFTLHAAVEARVIRQALVALHEFDLRRDAACFSASDREALLDIIADWFADAHSGEHDAAGMRQVGIHRFESFVRFELAPEIAAADQAHARSPLELLALFQVMLFGWALDCAAMPGSTLYDLLPLAAQCAFGAGFVIPMCFWSSHVGASVVAALRERCGCSTAVAYSVGFVSMVPLQVLTVALIWALPFPQQWGWADGPIDTDSTAWNGTDHDGLDTVGRRLAKWHIFLAIYGTAAAIGCTAKSV
jgi:hypothetical protein